MSVRRIAKKLLSLAVVITVLLYGCFSKGKEPKTERLFYLAIKDRDTASLSLEITGTLFKGKYEINYHGSHKDSGDVKGRIKGDTLLGDYIFQHYGMEKWHRAPIALLKWEEKLVMGVGETETFLSKSYFRKGTVIDYDHVKFIFQRTK
ncbi:hypothetical protein [Pedobacter sp. FW305-3-2-15-E-R2A2]|uniref:hypothetical protein n=1 Tax=Pedobacter sp. FW305-3-2-15-E-R2A2 TaxID=3140251 RepID=UPI003140BBDD